ncbi:MAG: hypothetical protein QXR48_00435 [Candidatus Woesearchaeota archaeon]
MDKKGQVEVPVIHAGILLFSVMIALILFSIFYGVWEVSKKPTTLVVRDRERVVKEIAALQPNQAIDVITTGGGYVLEFYGAGNTNDYCKGKPCICDSESKTCVILQKIESNCEKGMCAINPEPEVVAVAQGTPVRICRKMDNSVHIGAACS